MLTPDFLLSQTKTIITIEIFVPFVKVIDDGELHCEGHSFTFYSDPYFLRLAFSHAITKDGSSVSTNKDSEITIVLQKKFYGQHFKHFDRPHKLLESEYSCSDDDETFSLQKMPEHLDESEAQGKLRYGFGNKKCQYVLQFESELSSVLEIKKPDSKTAAEANEERMKVEFKKFDESHYLADLYESSYELEKSLALIPSWEKIGHLESEEKSEFISITPEEFKKLKKLKSNENILFYLFFKDCYLQKNFYLNNLTILNESEEEFVLFGLVDIICAYAYNVRFTEEEDNVEAGWNIQMLSPTLSWLHTHSSLKEVFINFIRRSLIYPFCRNWKLAMKCTEDCMNLFRFGKDKILKCLLEVLDTMENYGHNYILNMLYISEYCVWAENLSSSTLEELVNKMKIITISKQDVELNLIDIEAEAQDFFRTSEITDGFSALDVNQSDTSSDSDSDDTSSVDGNQSDSECSNTDRNCGDDEAESSSSDSSDPRGSEAEIVNKN
ncbi:Protein SHQ1 [Nymphon striatum]|nr:Protein SHQ1 [Nymphon striatum]